MKMLLSVCGLVMAISVMVSHVSAAGKADVKIVELTMIRMPEKEMLGKEKGIIVKMVLTHPDKAVAGIDGKASKINFTDSTGKDLFAAGKAQKATWRKEVKGIRYSDRDQYENTVSVAQRDFHDPKNNDPKEVLIQCIALTLPAKDANSISIKGPLVLKTKAKAIKSVLLSPSDLVGKNVVKLGTSSLKLKKRGSGSYGKDRFISLQCESDAILENVSVVGKETSKRLLELKKGSAHRKPSLYVYSKNLSPDHKIKLEYSTPEKETVAIDVKIGPGFGFIVGK